MQRRGNPLLQVELLLLETEKLPRRTNTRERKNTIALVQGKTVKIVDFAGK